ncbi:hypothetical protein BC936DRAFT_142577 [Jimgerdemannia flammicorona]|uniref:Inositol polyphosphate-related phosphatase domain-containing protein n=1 Tax=Jimgerdemannia flammicorona TaxID=994334 RepID=A0A433DF26_9FUNG|nr:hypothetical protein BC936DRAFT_142577 [Jimgerdemannia flammicorona]
MDTPDSQDDEPISFHSVKQMWANQEQRANQTPPPPTLPRAATFHTFRSSATQQQPTDSAPLQPPPRRNPFGDHPPPLEDPPLATATASSIASVFESRIVNAKAPSSRTVTPSTSRRPSVSSLEPSPGSRTPNSRPSTPPQGPILTGAAIVAPRMPTPEPPEPPEPDPASTPPPSKRVSLFPQQFNISTAAATTTTTTTTHAEATSGSPFPSRPLAKKPSLPTILAGGQKQPILALPKRSSVATPPRTSLGTPAFYPGAAIPERNPFHDQEEHLREAVPVQIEKPVRGLPATNNTPPETAKRTPPPPPPSRRSRTIAHIDSSTDLLPPMPQHLPTTVFAPPIPQRPVLPARPSLVQTVYQSNTEMKMVSPTDIPDPFVDNDNITPIASPPSLPPRPAHALASSDEATTPPRLPPRRASVAQVGRSMTTIIPPERPPALPNRPGLDSSARFSLQLKAGSLEHLKNLDSDVPDAGRPDPRRFSLPADKLLTASVLSALPNYGGANRRPPELPSDDRCEIQHKGPFKSIALSGALLVTGMNQTRIWDTATGENIRTIHHAQGSDVRVLSMRFAPSLGTGDEGRWLWTGLHDGQLWSIDVRTGGKVATKTTAHSHPVTHILRYRNTEMWTLDSSGVLQVWSDRSESYDAGAVTLDGRAKRWRVAQKQTHALVVRDTLWTSQGKTIEVFNTHDDNPSTPRPLTVTPDVGNITALCTDTDHVHVYVAHDNGKVSVWDPVTRSRVTVVAVSPYGIAAMEVVGEHYLWAGFNTGKVYVYDTRPERWIVTKAWEAHHGPVQAIVADATGLVTEGVGRVACVSDGGNVKVYDGLLTEDWIESRMRQHEMEYCKYNGARLLVCSWNIDACKPEDVDESNEDLEQLRQWLGSMEEPDIVAIGIQEIVDLESKRQNARWSRTPILRTVRRKKPVSPHKYTSSPESFFSTKKKSTQEEEDLLRKRHRVWHDRFIELTHEIHGDYTVVKTEQLVGMFSCILVRKSEAGRVIDKCAAVVKTGLGGLHGNKGGIAIRFLFDDSSICLVNCHLGAGQSHVLQRNQDADHILQGAELDALPDKDVFGNGGDGSMVLDHEICIFSGDLNYRIDLPRDRVIRAVEGPAADWPTQQAILFEQDQLRKQQNSNQLFRLSAFHEAPITFTPTYKYDPGTDHYDRSEKKRVPAWCDRVLFRGDRVKNISYQRFECRVSDHRPISAGFEVQVKTIDPRKRDEVRGKVEAKWADTLERKIMESKVRYLVGYGYRAEEVERTLEQSRWIVNRALELLGRDQGVLAE